MSDAMRRCPALPQAAVEGFLLAPQVFLSSCLLAVSCGLHPRFSVGMAEILEVVQSADEHSILVLLLQFLPPRNYDLSR